MIYGVFSSSGDNFYIIGYFNNRLEAEKYCAIFNEDEKYSDYKYYTMELKNLKNEKDLSKVSLKYCYSVTFYLKKGKWEIEDYKEEWDRGNYISEKLKPDKIFFNNFRTSLIAFYINLDKDDRKLAEKIAQDYLYQLLSYSCNIKPQKQYIDLMNKKFKEERR